MNRLSFKIIPSPESNDHQVRIIVDDNDWLNEDYLGIDPPRFFKQDNFLAGELLIGRCDCGVEGCCDKTVDVQMDNDNVSWTNGDGLLLQFDKKDYTDILNKTKSDYSWEDINRRVERLISNLFIGTEIKGGLSFDWASCRIEPEIVYLSYSKKGFPEEFKQELLKIKWDGKTETDALNQAEKFMQKSKIKK